MYNPAFWKAFNTRPELSSDSIKRVITPNFTYQLAESDNPLLNKVFYINGDNLEGIFAELAEIFKDKTQGFEVSVRDSDHPDLERYLLDHGYKQTVVSDFRVLKLTSETIESLYSDKEIPYELRELSREEMYSDGIYQLLKRCFPDHIRSQDQHNSINDIMFEKADGMGSILRNYALYDGNTPVAFGSLFDMGEFQGIKIANLSGAATLPEYRNQGMYTLMLYLRCRDAFEKGIEVLYITADQSTSSPIVAKYGFETVDVIKEFVWVTDEANQSL